MTDDYITQNIPGVIYEVRITKERMTIHWEGMKVGEGDELYHSGNL